MRQYKRSRRLNRLLQEEISDIVRTGLRNPNLGFLSITRVEATEDMRSAKVYISVLDDSTAEETVNILQKAAGHIRGELLHRLHTRRVPELRFFVDRSIAYSVHIAEVIDGLKIEPPDDEEESEG